MLARLSIATVCACSASTSPAPAFDADPPGVDSTAGDAPDSPGMFMLVDDLRGDTTGNPVGGSFGPDGWTVTAATDRIWYALPRLTAGALEVTVTNMSNANLVVNDNEILALYEAGYGIAEPVRYSPEFRNNHYKTMVRVYGSDEVGRAGQQKLMWGMCPSGAPGYDACGCGSFFEETFGGDGAWSGAPERLRIEWGGGTTRLLRNGDPVVTIDWSGSGLEFAPSELHFSIGTSRPSAVGTAAMPIGAVFSDLLITGTEGPVGACPP
jgi:hypothetical protein